MPGLKMFSLIKYSECGLEDVRFARVEHLWTFSLLKVCAFDHFCICLFNYFLKSIQDFLPKLNTYILFKK